MPVRYLTDPHKVIEKPVKRYGILQQSRGQNQFGYGNKISTDYQVRIEGERNPYRVYAICWSNVVSHYIVRRGVTLFVRFDREDVVQEG